MTRAVARLLYIIANDEGYISEYKCNLGDIIARLFIIIHV